MLQGHLRPSAQMGMFVCDMDQLDKRDTEGNTKKQREGLTSNMTLELKKSEKDEEIAKGMNPGIKIISKKKSRERERLIILA